MPTKPFKATIATLPRDNTREGTSGSAVITDGAIFVFHWVEPNTLHPMHEHPEDQLAIVFEGSLELQVEGDEEKHTINAGELFYIPANTPHSGKAVGDATLAVLNAYSPINQEFTHLAAHQPGLDG
jgi:mannose-6-phosphate isomerase-like protein (cupin superfamily)